MSEQPTETSSTIATKSTEQEIKIINNIEEEREERQTLENNTTAPTSKPSELTRNGITSVIGSFLIHFVVLGTLYSFGVFLNYYERQNLGTSSTISLIGACGLGCLTGFGMLSGVLTERFGHRIVICTGGILLGIAMILTSFAVDLWQYVVLQGFLFGFGCSLAYFPALSAPSFWFIENRGIATGIAVSGSGVGGFVISIVQQRLIESIGVEWTLRTTGIFNASITIASAFLVRMPAKSSNHKKTKFPFHLIKDPIFIFLFGMPFIGTVGYLIPIVYIPSYAVTFLGATADQGALAVAVFNMSSTVGRLAMGLIADKLFGRFPLFIFCFFSAGLSILLVWTTASSIGLLFFFAILYGFLCGGVISLLPVVVADVYGLNALTSMIGMVYFSATVGNVAGPPLAGAILEATAIDGVRNWIPAMVFAGVSNMVGSCSGLVAFILWRRMKNSQSVVESSS